MQPLDFVVWGITIYNTEPQPRFLDDHGTTGIFYRKYFKVDSTTVHEVIINLCDGNKNVNNNVQSLMRCPNGRMV